MEVNEFTKTLETALKNGCRFCSFMYNAKGSGETAVFTVLLGVNLINAYKRDASVLSHLKIEDGVMKVARDEVVKSLQDSIVHGLGNNAHFTQKGVYQFLGKGARLHKEEKTIHLTGFIINKQVVKAGEYKAVKSSAKTICKKKLAQRMKCRKFRDFIFSPEHIGGMKINGKVLEIQNS